MPKLDRRLSVVAELIDASVHADIGSDHGNLLATLLVSKRIRRGIAIENKPAPYENSLRRLVDLNADVRLADGLAGLNPGEADSLSLCGMGGHLIERILCADPERIPDRLVLQPNNAIGVVRRWAFRNGFCLTEEQLVDGEQGFVVLRLERSENDDAYRGVGLEAGFEFGPLMLRRKEPRYFARLTRERAYLEKLPRRTDKSQRRLELLCEVLSREPRR